MLSLERPVAQVFSASAIALAVALAVAIALAAALVITVVVTTVVVAVSIWVYVVYIRGFPFCLLCARTQSCLSVL